MKNIKEKIIKNKNLLFLTIIVGLIVHLPLLTKDILSADIILNNTYYSGYSWEVSLGRFGLFIIGLLKNYIVIPHIEIFLSLILVSFISIELIDLFNIKDLIKEKKLVDNGSHIKVSYDKIYIENDILINFL